MSSLKGGTSIVTGATEGIGRAITFALGQRGTTVAVCARTPSKVRALVNELNDAGIDAIGQRCDVANEESVTQFVAYVRDRCDGIDLLVNNAGLAHRGNVDEMDAEAFDETMAVNVRGVFLMTRAVLSDMKRRRRGSIVSIASLAGKNGVAGSAAYSASKHAVLGFSKSLMLEVRQHGIRVLTICPGSVVTPFFQKSGMVLKDPERKLQPEDVADALMAALELPERAAVSELDIRPTNP